MKGINQLKKFLAFYLMAFCFVSFSYAQIYKGEAETKNGTIAFTLHYIEYTGYRCLFHMDGVSIFLTEENIDRLEAVLAKFIEWEEMASSEQISLTRTIDSITFTSFHYSHTFYREPLILYFVFTGGPLENIGIAAGGGDTDNSGEAPPTRYTLFVDTTLERIVSFRLTSKTVQELYFALSPEQMAEAWDAYEQQRSLEEMFQ